MLNVNVLGIIWFGSAILGAVAVAAAMSIDRLRSRALLVAGFSFGIAGILGILSIGVLFLAASAICFSRR